MGCIQSAGPLSWSTRSSGLGRRLLQARGRWRRLRNRRDGTLRNRHRWPQAVALGKGEACRADQERTGERHQANRRGMLPHLDLDLKAPARLLTASGRTSSGHTLGQDMVERGLITRLGLRPRPFQQIILERRRRGIIDRGKIVLHWLHRLEQVDQSALARWTAQGRFTAEPCSPAAAPWACAVAPCARTAAPVCGSALFGSTVLTSCLPRLQRLQASCPGPRGSTACRGPPRRRSSWCA